MHIYSRTDWGYYQNRTNVSDFTALVPTYHYNSLINNDKPQYKTPKFESIDESPKMDVISGSGFLDTLKEKFKNIPKYVNKAADLYSGEIGTTLRNMIPSSDENARPGFKGEKHAILELPNGKNGVANYMGPGTNVIARLQRGDPGRTKSDSAAKMHDILYNLSDGEKTKSAQLIKIREADNRMIKNLQKIREDKSDTNRNIQLGMRLIQAKKIGEDIGILDKSKFAGDIGTLSKSDSILLEKEINLNNQATVIMGNYYLDKN
jgi:hypothetical protein